MSILPITLIVCLLNLFVNVGSSNLINFIICSILLIFGMTFFSVGVDSSMMVMGQEIGNHLTKKRNLFWLLFVGFLIGFLVTIAEPDLTVLANQFKALSSKYYLIIPVALGVGIFMVIAILRILFKVKLKYILLFFYSLILVMIFLINEEFVPISLDSGGVTTGPITVPFILAFGTGIAMQRSSKGKDDSFGLVAICSIGPIFAVLILGFILKEPLIDTSSSANISFIQTLLNCFKEVLIALLPIMIFFIIYQFFILKLSKKRFLKILVGLLFSFLGLTLFLTGVNYGFMPIAQKLGSLLGNIDNKLVLIPIAFIIGFVGVIAEPAVHVLNNQVFEITSGTISKKTMLFCLSIGVGISLVLSVLRIIFDISIYYIIVPGYILALILMFFVPNIFTAIAFDSGGVASGAITASFVLPLVTGICEMISPDKILLNAFGVVAFTAMTPLIVIQLLGLVYKIKSKNDNSTKVTDIKYEIIEFNNKESDRL